MKARKILFDIALACTLPFFLVVLFFVNSVSMIGKIFNRFLLLPVD